MACTPVTSWATAWRRSLSSKPRFSPQKKMPSKGEKKLEQQRARRAKAGPPDPAVMVKLAKRKRHQRRLKKKSMSAAEAACHREKERLRSQLARDRKKLLKSNIERGLEDQALSLDEDQRTSIDPNKKRGDYLEWPEYFMAIAFLSAQRSKDPSSQVGACIVNEEKKIVGIGYNGMPNGCSDDILPWRRIADNKLETKYPYVCHAELNAILNKNTADVKGCTMYVALFPCNECAKLVIQSGIRNIIFMSDKYHDAPEFVASRKLLDLAGVKYRKFEPKRRQILIDFDSVDFVKTPDTTSH